MQERFDEGLTVSSRQLKRLTLPLLTQVILTGSGSRVCHGAASARLPIEKAYRRWVNNRLPFSDIAVKEASATFGFQEERP
jgi:hypothetical protein